MGRTEREREGGTELKSDLDKETNVERKTSFTPYFNPKEKSKSGFKNTNNKSM